MTIIDQIRKDYRQMSQVERRIADIILADPQKVPNMTIAHLADQAHVSEGSVVNFSDRLGVRGFSALKIGLAREMNTLSGLSFGSVTSRDGPWEAFQKVVGNAVDTFQKLGAALRPEEFTRAAELLMSARRVDIYGAGDSALMAQDAYFHFMRIGLPAYAVTDYLTYSIAASQLDSGCVALAISHSGQTIEIIDAVAAAKKRGAATICITSYAGSTLSGLCDLALVTRSGEAEQHEEAAVSRLAHLLVLDSLCAYISAQRGPEIVERLEQVELQLGRHRYRR